MRGSLIWGLGWQLVRWRRELLRGLCRAFLAFEAGPERDVLREVARWWGQFFGADPARDWPGLAWAMPFYVPTGVGLRRQVSQLSDRVLEVRRLARDAECRPKIRLRFGIDEPSVELSLERVRLRGGSERGPGETATLVRRERTGLWTGGRTMLPSLEEHVGLAGPDDVRWLQRGYFPGYADLLSLDECGGVSEIGFRYLLLARLRPCVSECDAWVHQLVVPLDPRDAGLLGIHATVREFGVFLAHYEHLGFRQLLFKRLGYQE